MSTTLIIPGLHGSGPGHWQTWLQQQLPGSLRVVQRDWHEANLPDWSGRVRLEITRNPGRIFLIAHSFGVLAAAQAAFDHAERIAGALFVAPADPDRFNVSEHLPWSALGFPAVVVASRNDPWMTLERAAHWADVWDVDLLNLGAAGHINEAAGFGPWPEGLAIFERLRRSSRTDQTNRAGPASSAGPARAWREDGLQRRRAGLAPG